MTLIPRLLAPFKAPLLLGLIVLLVLPILLLYPFHVDVDIYRCVAVLVRSSSEPPVRAAFVANLPAIVWVHWLAIELFGNTVTGFRMFEWMWQGIAVVCLYAVCRLWFSESLSLVSCLLYAFVYVHGPTQFVGQPDCFVLLPILVGIWCFIWSQRSEGQRRWIGLLLSGAAYGIATTFRPTFALLFPLPIVLFYHWRKPRTYVELAVASAGFSIGLMLVVLPFAQSWDGLQEMYREVVRYNADVYRNNFSMHGASWRSVLAAAMVLVWLIVLYRSRRKEKAFLLAPERKNERRFLIGTFAALLLGVVSMRRLAGYHFIPFFALSTPVFVAIISESFAKRRGAFVAVVVGMVLFLMPWTQVLQLIVAPTVSNSSGATESDSINETVSNYLLAHTGAADAVEIAALEPKVRWRLPRPAATRFSFLQVLVSRAPNGKFTWYQREWQQEYVAGLQSSHLKYYVIQYLAPSGPGPSSVDLFYQIPDLKKTIEDRYQLDTTLGPYLVYRQKLSASGARSDTSQNWNRSGSSVRAVYRTRAGI